MDATHKAVDSLADPVLPMGAELVLARVRGFLDCGAPTME